MVNKESLVIIDNEWGWWKRFNIILNLHISNLWFSNSLFNLLNNLLLFHQYWL